MELSEIFDEFIEAYVEKHVIIEWFLNLYLENCVRAFSLNKG